MCHEVKVRAYLSEDVVGLLDDSITKPIGSTSLEKKKEREKKERKEEEREFFLKKKNFSL